MINNLTRNSIYLKLKEFRSFLTLIGLLGAAIIIINTYDNFRNHQIKYLENLLQNTYLQKTLKSTSNSLEPRFEKINYIINSR